VTLGGRFAKAYTTAACEVGREAARRLGLPEAVQRGVYHVYEDWRGEASRPAWPATTCRPGPGWPG
jgi:hypothetical protein